MFPSNSGSLAMALGSMRVMKLWVARILGVRMQKTRMDPTQCRLVVICLMPGLITFRDLGLNQFTATWPNVTFVCLLLVSTIPS